VATVIDPKKKPTLRLESKKDTPVFVSFLFHSFISIRAKTQKMSKNKNPDKFCINNPIK
jgi:hypothetical protein